MSESRDIRDPVFGFIRLDGTESNIVSSPIFQRLRRIRQLAFANLVYPGAHHTRFEHSLGVCHIASLLATSLGVKAQVVRFRQAIQAVKAGVVPVLVVFPAGIPQPDQQQPSLFDLFAHQPSPNHYITLVK